MNGFWIRVISLLMVVGMIMGYNNVLASRQKDAQIAKMEAMMSATEEGNTSEEAGNSDEVASADSASEADGTGQASSAGQVEASGDVDGFHSIDIEGLPDGKYKGEAEGFDGTIKVTVTIKNSKIADITIDSAEGEGRSYLSSAGQVITEMIEGQTTEVDAVSGATFTSEGIINAVEAALNGA